MNRKTRHATRTHANGALETTFPVDPNPEPRQATRQRRGRKKVAENATPVVAASINEIQPTTTSSRRKRQEDPVLHQPAQPIQDIVDTHSESELFINPVPLPIPLPRTPPRQMTRVQTPTSAESFPSPGYISSPSDSPLEAWVLQGLSSQSNNPHRSPLQPPTESQTPGTTKANSRATDVWEFYIVDGEYRLCILCQKQQCSNKRSKVTRYALKTGTSVLRKHLCDTHGLEWIDACHQLGIDVTAKIAQGLIREYRELNGVEGARNNTIQRHTYSPEAFLNAITDWIIQDDQSINVIEHPKLRSIFLMLREDLRDGDIPHRTTVHNRIMDVWDDHLDYLQSEIAKAIGKVSTTSDIWTDPNLSPFMGLTAHWIATTPTKTLLGSQFTLSLRSELIGFFRIPGHHDGMTLAKAFLHVIDRVGMAAKLGWVTLDNASNNDTLMSNLERDLKNRKIAFSHVKRRIRCFPHVVNLACKAVTSAISSIHYISQDQLDQLDAPNRSCIEQLTEDPIAKVRNVIRIIRGSSIRRQHFSTICESIYDVDLQLLRDVETRWSSTLLMIERAIILRQAISTFFRFQDFIDLAEYQLNDLEWSALAIFQDILTIPHTFQQQLSAEKTPTLCDVIPAFNAMEVVWKEHQKASSATSHIVQAGIDKLNIYLERTDLVPAYVLALVLNPAAKLDWFKDHAPDKVQKAKEILLSELQPYYDANVDRQNSANKLPLRHRDTPTQQRTAKPSRNTAQALQASSNMWANKLLQMKSGSSSSSRTLSTLEAEIDAYLLDGHFGTSSLVYWQENQLRYPTFFAAAMDILPIQASAVPCERVFSSGKETMTARRNRISHELMEALQMIKFSLKNGKSLNFTAGLTKDEELEALEDEITDVVDDMLVF